MVAVDDAVTATPSLCFQVDVPRHGCFRLELGIEPYHWFRRGSMSVPKVTTDRVDDVSACTFKEDSVDRVTVDGSCGNSPTKHKTKRQTKHTKTHKKAHRKKHQKKH
ncbi:uncharacterized protein IUM83_06474 [Phytophthora cinnamomi]|uniref:uncharacterized protein n=1 Tax=Phytophthora cinnamomi TaxID=4785 RepID=UPI00355AB711|nr:hypothetical protein IUM83_06474 [Phytophthora cinnamomi]